MESEAPQRLQDLSAPYLAEYFGVWAMHEEMFRSAVERVNQLDIRLHVQRQNEIRAASNGRGGSSSFPTIGNGIAVIDLVGTLMKQSSSLDESTSTAITRREVRAAANDDTVRGILLRVDSPGGSVAGTQDLADDVAAAAAKKPVLAYIEDLGCSAAYWIASQAGSISCNATAIVGSIGTYATLVDSSRRAAMLGFEVHVIRAGDRKGGGTAGTKVTADQIAKWQSMVDDLNGHFLAGVSRGRKMDAGRIKELATGDVWIGAAAKQAGLVDNIESFDAAVARLEAMSPANPVQPPNTPKKGTRAEATQEQQPGDTPAEQTTPDAKSETKEHPLMSQAAANPAANPAAPTPAAEQPATMAQLKAAFPGASADFLVEQAEKNATMAQATTAFIGWQDARIRAREQELAQAKAAKPTEETPRKPGNQPVGAGTKRTEAGATAETSADEGDAGSQFRAIVETHVKAGMQRDRAVSKAARENPTLHARMIEEATAEHQRRHAGRR